MPELLDIVPVSLRRKIWSQHDGAPAHFPLTVRDYLNRTFAPRWIRRSGPILWPSPSPDLSSMDFFLWGNIKTIVKKTIVDSESDLVARIYVTAANAREMPNIFERLLQSMHRRCEAYIIVDCKNFSYLW